MEALQRMEERESNEVHRSMRICREIAEEEQAGEKMRKRQRERFD